MKSGFMALVLLLAGTGRAAAQADFLQGVSLDSLLRIEVSSATRYSQKALDAPGAITVITAEEIRRYGDRTLDQVLARAAGFYTSNDRNYTYLGVRGFSRPTDYNNRVVLLLDGRALNEPFYGSMPAGTELPIDLGAVERIEVLRGPASALFGGGAMLALVNVITQRAAETPKLEAEVSVGNAGAREGALRVARRWSAGELAVAARLGRVDGQDVYYSEYDAPETNRGVAEDLDWDEYASVLANGAYGRLRFQLLATHRQKGVPTGAWGMAFNDVRARTRDDWYLGELTYGRELSEHVRVEASAWLHRYDYEGVYPGEVLYEDQTATRSAGADVRGTFDLTAANRLVTGIEAVRHLRAEYRSWSPTGVDFDGDYPFSTAALYVQDEQSIGARLSVTAGVRVDLNSEVRTALSPRVAAVYRIDDDMVLKLLAATAFRAPNSYEREFWSDEFTRASGLSNEQIRRLELAAERRLSTSLHARASAFVFDMEELLDTVELPDGSFGFVNRADVEVTGGELDVTAERGRFSGYLRYTGLSTRVEAGDPLTNAPNHLLKLGAALRIGRYLAPSLDVQHVAGRRTVQGTKADAYTLVNGVLHVGELRGWSAGLRVRNLLDTGYSTPGGFEHAQAAIRQDGRRSWLHVEYRLP